VPPTWLGELQSRRISARCVARVRDSVATRTVWSWLWEAWMSAFDFRNFRHGVVSVWERIVCHGLPRLQDPMIQWSNAFPTPCVLQGLASGNSSSSAHFFVVTASGVCSSWCHRACCTTNGDQRQATHGEDSLLFMDPHVTYPALQKDADVVASPKAQTLSHSATDHVKYTHRLWTVCILACIYTRNSNINMHIPRCTCILPLDFNIM
jgi:hypothetical protein